MEQHIKEYLQMKLVPVLSRKFNLVQSEVADVVQNFDTPKYYCMSEKKKETPYNNTKADEIKIKDGVKPLAEKLCSKSKIDISKLSRLKREDLLKIAVENHIYISNKKIKKTDIITLIKQHITQDQPQASKTLTTIKKPLISLDFNNISFKNKNNQIWNIKEKIAMGGFGSVYNIINQKNELFVIKIGKYDTFSERGTYMKLKNFDVKTDSIILKQFNIENPNAEDNGIPTMVESGILTNSTIPCIPDKEKYYYIILPRFEKNLKEYCSEMCLSTTDINYIINSILKSLKFINAKNIIHLDIKAENIMLKNKKWFLIDYGLSRHVKENVEKNIKDSGNGTLPYMSIDAHQGILSRRSDLQSLVYTLLEMDGVTLPWHRLKNKKETKKDFETYTLVEKNNFHSKIMKLDIPQSHLKFIEKVNLLQINDIPDYDSLMLK